MRASPQQPGCGRPRNRADYARISRAQRSPAEESMKLYVGLLAATAVMAQAGPGRADDSDKFVVRGDATKVIMEQNQVNVATAEAISKACVEEAVKQGGRVTNVTHDQFGEPVCMYRMDGQAKVAIETAMMKAHTAINTRQP